MHLFPVGHFQGGSESFGGRKQASYRPKDRKPPDPILFPNFVSSRKKHMSKLSLLSAYFVLIFSAIHTQNACAQDAVFSNIRSQLPEGWVMETKDKRLIFSRKDSIWIKHVNKMNQQAGSSKLNAEQRIASFKKDGKRAKAMLSYRLEPKWSEEALKKAEAQNKKIFAQIAKLPAKYKIEALYDSILSEKGTEMYIGKTSEDKAQIKKYEEDRDKLLKNITALPFLQSEKFSLFPDIFSGSEDAYTDVYPEQASTEWFKVQNTVTELCKRK